MNTILRLPAVLEASGLSRSQLYTLISNGLWTKQVKISERNMGWPASEVAALNAYRIAGKSEQDIRQLVVRLVAARKAGAKEFDK